MRIVLLHNPKSGRANTRGRVQELAAALKAERVEVRELESGPGLREEVLHGALAGADAVVVAGGDGSVHYAAPAAMACGVPVYHFPCGTENLFAREFGMSDRAEEAVEALRRGKTRSIDTGVCNGRVFIIMAGIGFDAAVVGRVAAARTKGVTRGDYVKHAADELRAWNPARLSVAVDGREFVADQPGQLIIANLKQYAARLNPLEHARPDDGVLEVLFLSCSTRVELAGWMATIAAGKHMDHRSVRHTSGRRIEVRGDGEAALQLDGEAVRGGERLEIEVRPGSMRVLLPG